jgi:hypothetical protein
MQWYIAYVLVFFQQIIDMRKKRPELRMTLNEKVAIVLVLSQMLTMTQNYIQVQEVIQWADEILRESEKETKAGHQEPLGSESETNAPHLEY